jgi:hypothetical protein
MSANALFILAAFLLMGAATIFSIAAAEPEPKQRAIRAAAWGDLVAGLAVMAYGMTRL